MLLDGQRCSALIDTGSMVTTLSEAHFNSLDPKPELLQLSDFALEITGANDSSVPYLGYSLINISIPEVELQQLTVPVLIVPSTKYSAAVPVVVGINVINYIRSSLEVDKIPAV